MHKTSLLLLTLNKAVIIINRQRTPLWLYCGIPMELHGTFMVFEEDPI